MLKITTRMMAGLVILELEGKLAGLWVRELEVCWRTAVTQNTVVRVDLSAVMFIDTDGKELLDRMYRQGTELVAKGCLNKCIVEGIMRSEEKRV